jgi:hypothetical protein
MSFPASGWNRTPRNARGNVDYVASRRDDSSDQRRKFVQAGRVAAMKERQ